MSTISNLSLIVSNIINGKPFSHCRLCLNEIKDFYVRYVDGVTSDPENTEFRPLSDILTRLLGTEIVEEVNGIDGVCTDCAASALEAFKFIEKCYSSNTLLQNAFDNVMESLDSLDVHEEQSLYIIVNENDSQLILMNKETPKTSSTHKSTDFIVTCHECDEEFSNNTEYRSHCQMNHDNFVCINCWLTIPISQESSHESNCVPKNKCSECNQTRASSEALKEHYDRAHKLYVCKECGKSYQGFEKLKVHEEKHSIKSRCPKCGKTYATRDFYLKHVKLCVEGLLEPHPFRTKLNKQFVCKQCGKKYSTSGGLRVHNRFEHGNAKPHICEFCNKKFTAPSYLKVHMVTHTGEKKFVCSDCGNKFVSKEALLYHTRRRHTGEKPYSCEICQERFVNASARAEHIKYKHVGPTLMCEICSRKFVTPHFLRNHIKRHHEKESQVFADRKPKIIDVSEENKQALHLNAKSEY